MHAASTTLINQECTFDMHMDFVRPEGSVADRMLNSN